MHWNTLIPTYIYVYVCDVAKLFWSFFKPINQLHVTLAVPYVQDTFSLCGVVHLLHILFGYKFTDTNLRAVFSVLCDFTELFLANIFPSSTDMLIQSYCDR